MNELAHPQARTTQAAVRQLLVALDDCDDLLKCSRVQEISTCLHRARQFSDERLCRACRLVSAVEELEKTTF